MTYVATLLITLVLVALVLWVLLHVRTPRYRLEADNVIRLLELVLAGRATASDWSVFTGVPLRHDAYLESVRQRCLEIEERDYTGDAQSPYLFSAHGLEDLRRLLDEVSTHAREDSGTG